MKKKFFAIRITALLLACIAALMMPALTAGADSYILGDADCDGSVSILDATVLQRAMASLPVRAFNASAADADGDGEVTIFDATCIQRWLASMSCPEGIGKPVIDEEPTEAPSTAPTEAPTEPPTEAPTEAPTAAPTQAPTEPMLESPVITSIKNTADGVALSWNAVDGAECYAVLRKIEGGSWVKKGVTAETSFTDITVSSGSEYTYKVRCTDAEGSSYTSPNTDEGPSIFYIKTPSLNSVTSVNDGVRVSFGTVKGAAEYEILRRTGLAEDFTVIASVTESPYIDGDVTGGAEYDYTVRAKSPRGVGAANPNPLSITYIAAPVLKSVENTAQGVKVEWEPSAGAERYRILRKYGEDGGWTAKDVVTGTSFVDENVLSGSQYTYTVRCVDDNDEYISGRDEEGLRILYLKAPALNSVACVSGGVKISFGTVAGAETYQMIRRGANGSLFVVGEAESSPFIDTTAVSGERYGYAVRAKNGEYVSAASAGYLNITYFAAPVMKSVENTVQGVRVEWEPSAGAERYRILRKYGEDGSWTAKDIVAGTSFVDENVSSGSVYSYSVRCVDENDEYISARDEDGLRIIYLRTPTLYSVTSVNEGVRFNFGAVTGATGFEILRRTGSGDYQTIATINQAPYIDVNVIGGSEYTYTVRAIGEDGAHSAANPDALSITYIAAPVMKSAVNTADGVRIEWEPSAGATYYCILKKSGENDWAIKDVVTGTSYVDDALYSGTTYYYTVRCVADDKTTYISGRDENGLSVTFLRQPELRTLNNVHNGVRLTYGYVAGAEGYEIYRRSGGAYALLAATADTQYHDTSVTLGQTYTYTVKAYLTTADGVARSSCDTVGLTVKAEDISYTAYVKKPFINLYENYTDDAPALTIPYMSELRYLETTKEYETGTWLKVEYSGSYYYMWEPLGEDYLADVRSSFEYGSSNEIVQKMLDLSMDMSDWNIVYRRGESTGIPAEDGTYGYDCSGFVSYVLDTVMTEYVPTYQFYAKVDVMYQLGVIYNKGIGGEFSVSDVDPSDLRPGDILFFNLEDEAEVDELSEGVPATHCGIYLGNNEFIHCTHYNWGATGLFIMPLTDRYADSLTLIRRFTPETPTPANKTMYSTSFKTNVRGAMSADADIIDTLPAETAVTVLYTSIDISTGDPMWAYITYGGGKTGFVSLDYLSDTLNNAGVTRYVAAAGVKLYEAADTSTGYVEIFCGTEVIFNGVYGNSHFYKINYNGEDRFMYCSDEVGIDSLLTDDYDTLMAGIGERIVTATTNLRSDMDASTSASVIMLVKKDTVVTLIATSASGSWSYVRLEDGTCGFITSSRLAEI